MVYIIYSLLIIICAVLGGGNGRLAKLFRVIACFLYISIVGFRHYTVGVDSKRYMELFYAIPDQDYQWIEIGFDKLIRLLYDAGYTYTGLFLVCILITAICIFLTLEKLYKNNQYTFSAILIYILTLTTVTNGMRQCLSVGLFFYGSCFIIERRLIPYILCIGMAFLFHSSSILLFPLYFLLNKSLNNKTYTIIYFISFALCFVNVSELLKPLMFLFSETGNKYAENFDAYAFGYGNLSIMGFIYDTIVNILIFIAMMTANSPKKHAVLTNCVFLKVILKNMSFHMPIVGRIAMYFSWFQYLLIPLLIVDLFKDKQARTIARIAIVLLLSISFVHVMVSDEMEMLPYLFNFELKK